MTSERLGQMDLIQPLCICPTAEGRRSSGLPEDYVFGVSHQSDARTDGSCCPPSWALPPERFSRTLTPCSAHSSYGTAPERPPRWFHTSAPLCLLARPEQKPFPWNA